MFEGLSLKTLLYDKWTELVKQDGMFTDSETSTWHIT